MAPVPSAPPTCLAPRDDLSRPEPALPEGSCDTHAHVIDVHACWPLAAARDYTPAPAPFPAYDAMLARLGAARGVLVQPSIYGTDNRLLLSCVAPRQDRLRAIVVIDEDTPAHEIARMHEAGARGFRINLLFKGGNVGIDALERLAALTAPFGWHAQLLIDAGTIGRDLEARLRALPVPVVFDHMGHFPAQRGTDWPGFQALMRLADAGDAWIKLSGAYRIDADDPRYEGAASIARALLARVPERLVWGTDWPHVGLYEHMPDTGLLAGQMARLCETPAMLRRVFVDNPARLYGFPGKEAG